MFLSGRFIIHFFNERLHLYRSLRQKKFVKCLISICGPPWKQELLTITRQIIFLLCRGRVKEKSPL